MAAAQSPSKTAALLGKLIEDIDIAMLTTVGADGELVSRPLSTQRSQYDGRRVWFFTEGDSPKVGEIRRHPKVNLAYASKDKNTYVSVAGRARVMRDQAMIDQFWNDALKAFFPKGKDDPNLVLLEVEPRTVEYWDGPGTWLGKVVAFVVARVTKREEVMGENRLLDLRTKPARSKLPPSHADARPRRAASKTPAKRAAAKKAPAKKAPAKKAPAKKAAAKKAPARKAAAKKAPAKRATGKTAARRAR
jgi:general stress protein 26